MSKEDALQEVTQVTLAVANQANQSLAIIDTLAVSPKGFVRLNLRVPAVRKLTKTPYHFLDQSRLSIAQQWNYIWRNTPYYEVACQALYYYQHSSLERHEIKIIQQWINRCDCWEHSDDLSKIYAQSIAYSAATEKLDPQIKAQLNRIRKEQRQGLKIKARQ